MNLRRVVASLALDGGAYARGLEQLRDQLMLQRDTLAMRLKAADERVNAMEVVHREDHKANSSLRSQLQNLETVFAVRLQTIEDRARAWQAKAEEERSIRAEANRAVKQLTEQNEVLATSNLELRASLTVFEGAASSFRLANVELERQLETEREEHAATTARAVSRINALESENDELRMRIANGGEEQLDLVPSPEVPEAKPEVVLDVEVEKVYLFAKIVFIDGHKWFFRDGGSEAFHAPILDAQFLSRVARREIAFTSGDAVRVRLHQVTTRLGNDLKTKCEMLKVIEILPPPPEQTTLLPEASLAS